MKFYVYQYSRFLPKTSNWCLKNDVTSGKVICMILKCMYSLRGLLGATSPGLVPFI